MTTAFLGTSSATSASTNGKGPILPDRIPKSVDKKADKDFDAMAADYPMGDRAGVPIVNVAVREELDNGRAKRKGRKPAIKEESSDDSDAPLVSLSLSASAHEPFAESRATTLIV